MSEEVREMTEVGGGNRGVEARINLFHKFLRSAGSCLTARNPSVVQAELISGWKDGL